jgi:hypothetical protein
MPKSTTKQVVRSTTTYEATFQRRNGTKVAIIEANTYDHLADGRGDAGRILTGRQVLVVPVAGLGNLVSTLTESLIYQATDDGFDLDNDATQKYGLYVIDAKGLPPRLVMAWYSLAEARVYSTAFAGKEGAFLARLPEDTSEEEQPHFNIIERLWED